MRADIYVTKSKILISSITAGGVPKFQNSPMNIPTWNAALHNRQTKFLCKFVITY